MYTNSAHFAQLFFTQEERGQFHH